MKKNKLIFYVLVFTIAVGAMAIYGKSSSEEFSEEKVVKYLNGIRLGIQDIYNRIPIDQFEREKVVEQRQMEQIAVSTERIFADYLDLKTMGTAFDFFEDKETETEQLLQHIHMGITDLYGLNKDIELTDGQLSALQQYYQYLYDLYQVDVYNMDVGEVLAAFEEVSEKHADLQQVKFH